MRYRNKEPRTVNAMQLPEVLDIDRRLEFDKWAVRHAPKGSKYHGSRFLIPMPVSTNMAGYLSAWPTDYLVKMADGIHVWPKTMFELMFEPAGVAK